VRCAYPGYYRSAEPPVIPAKAGTQARALRIRRPRTSAPVRNPAPPFAFSSNAADQKRGPTGRIALLESML